MWQHIEPGHALLEWMWQHIESGHALLEWMWRRIEPGHALLLEVVALPGGDGTWEWQQIELIVGPI